MGLSGGLVHYWGPDAVGYIADVLADDHPLFVLLRSMNLSSGTVFSYLASSFPVAELDDFEAEAPWSRDDSAESLDVMYRELEHVRRFLQAKQTNVILMYAPTPLRPHAPGNARRLRISSQRVADAGWECGLLTHSDADEEIVRLAISAAWRHPFVAIFTDTATYAPLSHDHVIRETTAVAMCQRLSYLVVNAFHDELWLFWSPSTPGFSGQ